MKGCDWRLAQSTVLSVLCVSVLGLAVHTGFERVRFRIVTASQSVVESPLTVALPDLTPLAGAPAAIVVRLTGAAEPMRLTLMLNSAIVARVSVAPREAMRLDTSVEPPRGIGHVLSLVSDRAGWQLDSLQIGNVHGFSDSAPSFVIVPRNRRADAIGWWWLAALLMVLVWARPQFHWHARGLQIVHRSAAGAVLLVFGCALLAPLLTQYRVLLSPQTFLLGAFILYVGSVPWQRWRPRAVLHVTALMPHLTVTVLFLVSVSNSYDPRNGFTPLIQFAEAFGDRAVPALQQTPHTVFPGTGHDGQFYAQLALDPLLRDEATLRALDNPSYRSRRILLSWMAWAIGFGDPSRILQAYALMNVASWLLLAWLLLRWLPPGSRHTTIAWVACMLNPGLRESVGAALLDGPSLALLAVAIVIVERNRRWLAAAVLALAGLARETNLLGGLGVCAPDRPTRRDVGRCVVQALLLATPLLLWLTYLSTRGLAFADAGSGAFAPPLFGYVDRGIATIREFSLGVYASRHALLTLVALSTQAALLLRDRHWQHPWWRVGIAYVALMAILGDNVWNSGDAAPRALLPMTVAFNLLAAQRFGRMSATFWPWIVFGNANLL
jgi:hypothetical protein